MPDEATVVVHVRGLRRPRGVALVALFDGDTRSREQEHARHVGAAPVESGEACVVFRGVAEGRYAAAVLRAEDDARAPKPAYADVVFDVVQSDEETHVELVPHEHLHAP